METGASLADAVFGDIVRVLPFEDGIGLGGRHPLDCVGKREWLDRGVHADPGHAGRHGNLRGRRRLAARSSSSFSRKVLNGCRCFGKLGVGRFTRLGPNDRARLMRPASGRRIRRRRRRGASGWTAPLPPSAALQRAPEASASELGVRQDTPPFEDETRARSARRAVVLVPARYRRKHRASLRNGEDLKNVLVPQGAPIGVQ